MTQNFWDYPVSQGFGPTNEPLDGPYLGYAHFNKGIDYKTPAGTSIVTPVAGKVIQAGPGNDSWGTSVKIQDPQGNIHNLGHLAGVKVNVGDVVRPGYIVGTSGDTGVGTGPHLSYDVWDSTGAYIEPSSFVGGGSAPATGARKVATPQQEDTARKLMGAPYDELDPQEQSVVDKRVKDLYGVEGLTGGKAVTDAQAAQQAPDKQTLRAPDGTQHSYGYNPATQRYDIDYGPVDADPTTRPTPALSPIQIINSNSPGNQAAITEKELVDAGYTKSRPGYYTRKGPNGVEAYAARRSPNGDIIGFDDVTQTDWTTNNPKPVAANLSPAQIAARAALDANKTNAEAGRIARGETPTDSSAHSIQEAAPGAVSAPPTVGSSYAPGADYLSSPQDVYGPANHGAPQFAGQWVPTDDVGGAQFRTAGPTGWAGQTLSAAGIIPSGDAQKDYIAALGADTKRNQYLSEGMSPTQAQSLFDTQNLGTDVYSRAKAVQATEAAAKAAYSGARLPAAGTDQLTAANLRDYLMPQPQPKPEDLLGFAEGGSIGIGVTNNEKPVVGQNSFMAQDMMPNRDMAAAMPPPITPWTAAPSMAQRTLSTPMSPTDATGPVSAGMDPEVGSKAIHQFAYRDGPPGTSIDWVKGADRNGNPTYSHVGGGPDMTAARFFMPSWTDENFQTGASTNSVLASIQRENYRKQLERHFGGPVALNWGLGAEAPMFEYNGVTYNPNSPSPYTQHAPGLSQAAQATQPQPEMFAGGGSIGMGMGANDGPQLPQPQWPGVPQFQRSPMLGYFDSLRQAWDYHPQTQYSDAQLPNTYPPLGTEPERMEDFQQPYRADENRVIPYANGGQQMLSEPVVGMGMQSGQPKFVAGEAGPEMATFTPMGGQGQTPPLPQGGMPPMGGQPPMPQGGMQPPIPQGMPSPMMPSAAQPTDPRLMALFAQTSAKRMKPRAAVAGGY